jgi:nicotinamidase-related amidase
VRTDELREGDALLIVDVQNDFCPDGALPIPDGDPVVPVLYEWIATADGEGPGSRHPERACPPVEPRGG